LNISLLDEFNKALCYTKKEYNPFRVEGHDVRGLPRLAPPLGGPTASAVE